MRNNKYFSERNMDLEWQGQKIKKKQPFLSYFIFACELHFSFSFLLNSNKCSSQPLRLQLGDFARKGLF